MILKLNIQKIEPGVYQAHCTGEASPTLHDSIARALLHYGQDIPPKFARFVEVRYHEVSLGTTEISRLTKESELMAQELVDLTAAVYQSIEDMKVVAYFFTCAIEGIFVSTKQVGREAVTDQWPRNAIDYTL